MMRERAEKLHRLQQERGGLAMRQEVLQAQLAELGGLIERLEMTLQPVLRDPGPTAALHGMTPEMPESPLGGFLRGATSHVQDLTARVQDLLDRVDL